MIERESIYASIKGGIVGDALGVPYEFTSPTKMKENPATTMTGYGTYNQPAGSWSDDSSMTLATMDSLINGVDYDDSFFAFYKREKKDGQDKYISKRKYIGIMPTGRTQMTTQMRLAAILLVHRAIFEAEHSQDSGFEFAANNYYSVISYFNSLKEVGKTDALFYTEYSKYVRRLFKRVMPYGNLLE